MDTRTLNLLHPLPTPASGSAGASVSSWVSILNPLRRKSFEVVARPLLKGAGWFLGAFCGDTTLKRYALYPWNDLVDMAQDIVVQNHAHNNAPDGPLAAVPLNRRHSQLPCTADTLGRRVGFAMKQCDWDSPIVVLGDDDLLTLALARAGFKDVTVLEIDARIIDLIEAESRKDSLNIRCVQQDLSKPVPACLRRPYSLVFLDPIYSPEGVAFFMDAAMKVCTRPESTRWFLSLHLASLGRTGRHSLDQTLRQRNLRVEAFFPAFNLYPMPSYWRRFIRLGTGILRRTLPSCRNIHVPRFFVSDGLVLSSPSHSAT